MLDRERHETILRVLNRSRFVTVGDIAMLVKSSEATVRRDFDKLEKLGHLYRVRGGAEVVGWVEDVSGAADAGRAGDAGEGLSAHGPHSLRGQLPYEYRQGVELEKKRQIAKKACSLCRDEETVIIDGGSTTYQMVEFLRGSKLKIITNSLAIASHLVKHSSNTVIIHGGVIYPDSELILDPFQEGAFKNYYADKLFMSPSGIEELGATNTDMLIIQTERSMLEHSRQLIIVADSSKFGRRGNLLLCGFERIHTLITDSGITEAWTETLRSNGVQLIVV